MTTNVSTDMNRSSNNGQTWSAILLIALGLLAIIAPRVSTLVAETWISLILISSGATKLFNSFQSRGQEGFIWKLLVSVLYILTGIYLFANPLGGVVTLTLLLGTFLLTEGTFELILALRVRPREGWTSVLGNAIVTLALGAIVWFQWPFNAPWLLGTAVGASIISTGLSRLMLIRNGQATMTSGTNSSPATTIASADTAASSSTNDPATTV
ncbi:HdeD family acid-resistance protein [Leptolyngbya ohadii]|uniref:HdeD family acid-resistance protein n=1 Tax=Leptolyngbya ohadii TaxID=1962290 RepID=UPI000B59F37A|nr:DUF308 domain-containing protein [Leptolyngbya ohadii]